MPRVKTRLAVSTRKGLVSCGEGCLTKSCLYSHQNGIYLVTSEESGSNNNSLVYIWKFVFLNTALPMSSKYHLLNHTSHVHGRLQAVARFNALPTIEVFLGKLRHQGCDMPDCRQLWKPEQGSGTESASPSFCIHIAPSPALYNKGTFENVGGLFRVCSSLTLFLDYSYNHKYNRNEANWNLIRKWHASYHMHPAFIYESA